MRGFILTTASLIAVTVLAPRAPASDASSATTTRLCQQVKQRKTMLVDKTRPEIIWSDGAMFEIAKTFPRELQDLIAAPTATRDLQPILDGMSGKTEEGWQDGKARSSRGREHVPIESADGKVTVWLASPYFDYLHERYPQARLRMNTPLSPVLFLVDGKLRAAVMGVAMPTGESKK